MLIKKAKIRVIRISKQNKQRAGVGFSPFKTGEIKNENNKRNDTRNKRLNLVER
tara:strand:- start:135 stop:296 length:162 start_codon:yes stop_codon:yes gene_type:complete